MEEFIITKNSMYPTLIEGDRIISAKSNNLKIGQIAIYKIKNRLVAHRIIRIGDKQVTLKGDNNIKSEKIAKDKIIGVVAFINKEKFSNNIFQRIITRASRKQENIAKKVSKKKVGRIFKILTNQILYIINISRIIKK